MNDTDNFMLADDCLLVLVYRWLEKKWYKNIHNIIKSVITRH